MSSPRNPKLLGSNGEHIPFTTLFDIIKKESANLSNNEIDSILDFLEFELWDRIYAGETDDYEGED